MKSLMKALVVLTATVGCLGSAIAAEDQTGYVVDGSGNPVRSGSGECWRSGAWSKDNATFGCDLYQAHMRVIHNNPHAAPKTETPAPQATSAATPATTAAANPHCQADQKMQADGRPCEHKKKKHRHHQSKK